MRRSSAASGSCAAARHVLVVGVHPQLAARALDDRRRLPVVVGVGVRADEQAHVLDAQVDLRRARARGARTSPARACRCRRARSRRRRRSPRRCSAGRRATAAAGAGARRPAARARRGRARACGWARASQTPDLRGSLRRQTTCRRRSQAMTDVQSPPSIHRGRDRRRGDRARRRRVLRGDQRATTSTRRSRCGSRAAARTSAARSTRPRPTACATSSAGSSAPFPDLVLQGRRDDRPGRPRRRALGGARHVHRRRRFQGVEPTGAPIDLEGIDVADRARRADRREQRLRRRR